MKSIMEEASSVIKAIEKGWIQAGKPQEFTIKVFEEATKNFIGITTKPAKVAIFFQERTASYTNAATNKQQVRQKPFAQRIDKQDDYKHSASPKKQFTQTKQPAKAPHAAPLHTEKPMRESQVNAASADKERETWTPEMVRSTQDWMQGLLSSLNKQHLTFSTEVKNYYLKINVAAPVVENSEQEKMLFRNCAYLIMQSLRNKFKKSFRGFKIILSSAR